MQVGEMQQDPMFADDCDDSIIMLIFVRFLEISQPGFGSLK
jgi:hypothetical protein